MSSRKDRLMSAEDKWVWRKLAETVKPLPQPYDPATFGELLDPQAAKSQPLKVPTMAQPQVPPPPRPHHHPLPDLDVGRMPGLDRRTAQRMTRGALSIEARVDLHGLTRDQAQGRLFSFINQSYEHGRRTVLVITGKGQGGTGVLKSEVPRWLNLPTLRQKILGFSHAQPKDGGDGALYVLIKRQRS